MYRLKCIVFISGLGLFFPAKAKEYSFDASLLKGAGKNADITHLEQGGQNPGIYLVNIYLNTRLIDQRNVEFIRNADNQLAACLSKDLLDSYGLNIELLSGSHNTSGIDDCARIEDINKATVKLDFNGQNLYLSIPQIALKKRNSGIAPQASWDDGVPAVLLDYRGDASYNQWRHGANNSVQTLQLQPGVNLGAWRVRNLSTFRKMSNQPGNWQSAYIYADRGINSIAGRLTLGESFTPADIFESVPFKGIMLASDERMRPAADTIYAPVISGIARTQARVDVKQGNYLLYSEVVAPGPFSLTDLSSFSAEGDLDVTVWETDGKPQRFTVRFQSQAIAVKEGYLKYNIMGGQYRNLQRYGNEPEIIQASAIYGFPWDLTLYSGAQLARQYQAMAIGSGKSLGILGAVSLDLTHTRDTRHLDPKSGQKLHFRYNLLLNNSWIGFSALRYSPGHRELSDAIGNTEDQSAWFRQQGSPRQRLGVTLNQGLPQAGRIYLTSTYETSYHSSTVKSVQVGYRTPVKSASLSLDWTLRETTSRQWRDSEQLIGLWLSLPLGRYGSNPATLSLRTDFSRDNKSSYDVGLQGSASNRQLLWDIRQQYSPHGQPTTTVHGVWYGGSGEAGARYRYSDNQRQSAFHVSGSIIAHEQGITTGQSGSGAIALISTPGAGGVKAGGRPGTRTDFRGYTFISDLMPYQRNIIAVDPGSLPDDAEVSLTNLSVVPTAGAIIPASFPTNIGSRTLFTVKQASGAVVPFGAVVRLADNSLRAGIVGDMGQLYLSGLKERGHFNVSWGHQQCQVNYELPKTKNRAGLYEADVICR